MSRKLSLVLALLLVFCLSNAAPLTVQAEDDPPNPDPIQPPWITGVNPQVTTSDDKAVEANPAAVAQPQVESPSYLELSPQLVGEVPASGTVLAVPQRYQDPADPTCGTAALGMALEFISLSGEGEAPSQAELVNGLKNSGLIYKTGTGVEELATLARSYGYRGTTAFHGGSLAKLQEELASGKPVVVSLGLNGADQPGHFVTLTGISADGKQVSYNDPILGARTVSAEEFLAAWERQGKSGLLISDQPLSPAQDPLLPWMYLFGLISALTVLAKKYPGEGKYKNLLSLLQGALGNPSRKGLGGSLTPIYEWQKVQDGTKVVTDTSKKIYEYGTRWVQNGVKTVKDYSKKIYEYGTRWVQNGVKTVKDYSKKIYEYGTRWVQNGWKTVKDYGRKIYKYGTRLVRKGWKKVTSWVKGIWGWFKKTKWKPKYVRQRFVKSWRYATKKVPKMVKQTFVKGWHYGTKTIPNMVKETFVKGWHYATKTVPKMVKETFVKGWHYATKTVPKYVWKKVRVGWEEVKEVVKDSAVNLPTPVPVPTPVPIPTPTPTPSGDSTPQPTPTPSPVPVPSPDDPQENENNQQDSGGFLSNIGEWLTDTVLNLDWWKEKVGDAVSAVADFFNISSGDPQVTLEDLPIDTLLDEDQLTPDNLDDLIKMEGLLNELEDIKQPSSDEKEPEKTEVAEVIEPHSEQDLPNWLINRTNPPTIDPDVWAQFSPRDRASILEYYRNRWESGYPIPQDVEIKKPDGLTNETWDDMSYTEKYTLSVGQSQNSTIITVLPVDGINLRESPSTTGDIKESVVHGHNMYWNGETEVDGQGRIWLYVSFPDGTKGWVAWRQPDGTKLVEISKGSKANNYPVTCEENDSCMTGFGDGHSWGEYHTRNKESLANQYLDVQEILKDAGYPDYALYPEDHHNLCAYLSSAWAAYDDGTEISLEKAVVMYAELTINNKTDKLVDGGPVGMHVMDDFFNELGYVTGRVGLSNALDHNIAMITVDYDAVDAELVDRDEKENDGHFAQLIEYDPVNGKAAIRDPFTNDVMEFGDGEEYSFDLFMSSFSGDVLIADK